jgi:hypothetical protein
MTFVMTIVAQQLCALSVDLCRCHRHILRTCRFFGLKSTYQSPNILLKQYQYAQLLCTPVYLWVALFSYNKTAFHQIVHDASSYVLSFECEVLQNLLGKVRVLIYLQNPNQTMRNCAINSHYL